MDPDTVEKTHKSANKWKTFPPQKRGVYILPVPVLSFVFWILGIARFHPLRIDGAHWGVEEGEGHAKAEETPAAKVGC